MLHNKYDKKTLVEKREAEEFPRITCSFYKYGKITEPDQFRDLLYKDLASLLVNGRIYIASEGINAQVSVPEHNFENFKKVLETHDPTKGVTLRLAVDQKSDSFYKLKIKVRKYIVADGLDTSWLKFAEQGKHLKPLEFHELVEKKEALIIDMRNFYESELGFFEGAYRPKAATFREEIKEVLEKFDDQKDQKILLYCTGGIRCEKASAYMLEQGFKDVNQLEGGIVEYIQQTKQQNIEPLFKGVNFVFDERMQERVTDDVMAVCGNCGKPSDRSVNCANLGCHVLFVQCPDCSAELNSCCSTECKDLLEEGERREASNLFNKSIELRQARGLKTNL